MRCVSFLTISKHRDTVKLPDDSEVAGDIESMSKQRFQIIEQIRSITSQVQLAPISAMAKDLESVLKSLVVTMCQLSKMYEDVTRMGELLQRAREDEIHAQIRISTEMQNLMALSVRMTEELGYIQGEREKLKFRAANDFQPVPFPELLHIDDQKVNASWQEIFNRASYGSVYN